VIVVMYLSANDLKEF